MDGGRDSGIEQHRKRDLVAAVIILAIMGLNLFRAIHQPVVHDEALTYNTFVPLSWATIGWAFYSNNHTLNTLLVKASTTVFGLSSLSLRLPALLGGLLYLLAVERLCRRACRGAVLYTLGLLGLAVSPFILDYLVAARGYSLALAFFTWALAASWSWLERPPLTRDRQRPRVFPLVSVLAALSVASNLAFAFVNTALLLTVWVAALVLAPRFRPRAVVEGALYLSLPGGILYLLIVPGIFNFDRRILFVGAESWAATWRSVVEALFGGFGGPNMPLPVRAVLAMAVQLILLLLAGLAAGTLLHRLLQGNSGGDSRKYHRRPADTAIFVATASILVLTVLLHTVAHIAAGVLLPVERTAIFFVPLGFLIVLLVPGCLRTGRFRSMANGFVTAAFTLFLVLFVCFRHVGYFAQWKYDANSHEVFLAVRSLARENPGASIGINWLFEPSLNFYRTLYHAAALPPFIRRLPTIDDAIFALLPARDRHDRRLLGTLPLHVVYADPLSGAVVAVKSSLQGAAVGSRPGAGRAAGIRSGP